MSDLQKKGKYDDIIDLPHHVSYRHARMSRIDRAAQFSPFAALTGYEPEDFIRQVDPRFLKCLHIQDNDYLGDRHTLPYLANLNWHEIMTALKKNGYEGDLTFEIVTYLQKFPKELLLEALKFAVVIGKYLISIYALG